MQFAKADAIQAFPMPTISDDSPKKNATNGELKQQLTTDYSMMRNLTRPKGLSGQPSSTTQSGHQMLMKPALRTDHSQPNVDLQTHLNNVNPPQKVYHIFPHPEAQTAHQTIYSSKHQAAMGATEGRPGHFIHGYLVATATTSGFCKRSYRANEQHSNLLMEKNRHYMTGSLIAGKLFNMPLQSRPERANSTGDDLLIQDMMSSTETAWKTATKEWPRCQRDKKQGWHKQVMNQRKSVLGVSQLRPSDAVKRQAIEKLRLTQDYNSNVAS